MSQESEKTVRATPLRILDVDRRAIEPANEEARAARKARQERRAEQAARWRAIDEAGGKDAWVERELAAKGVLVTDDPSALADSEKGRFKERKRAEARERRKLQRAAFEAYLATHVGHVGPGIFFRDEEVETTAEREARRVRADANLLTELDSIANLAKGLGLSMPELRWLCFHREVESASHYRFWTIPKRDGSRRSIMAPKPMLKAAQRWILHRVLERLPVHQAAHGFLRARSIASNAAVHAGAEVIVKLDIRDFFPTITFRRVKGLLTKAGLPENVAVLCALIATEPPRELVEFRGRTLFVATGPRCLPQGAPTSPAITNAICSRLDRRLSGLARTFGFVYTRYADDLTFSYRDAPMNPSESRSRTPAPIGALLRGVDTILRSEGFKLHGRKTSVMRAGASQRVTGLVVNQAPAPAPPVRVSRKVVRNLEAAIFNRENGRPPKGSESLSELKGLAAFVHMVDPRRGRAFLDRIAALEARA
jgi:hypothetical protein